MSSSTQIYTKKSPNCYAIMYLTEKGVTKLPPSGKSPLSKITGSFDLQYINHNPQRHILEEQPYYRKIRREFKDSDIDLNTECPFVTGNDLSKIVPNVGEKWKAVLAILAAEEGKDDTVIYESERPPPSEEPDENDGVQDRALSYLIDSQIVHLTPENRQAILAAHRAWTIEQDPVLDMRVKIGDRFGSLSVDHVSSIITVQGANYPNGSSKASSEMWCGRGTRFTIRPLDAYPKWYDSAVLLLECQLEEYRPISQAD